MGNVVIELRYINNASKPKILKTIFEFDYRVTIGEAMPVINEFIASSQCIKTKALLMTEAQYTNSATG